jgi:hypothetical protein
VYTSDVDVLAQRAVSGAVAVAAALLLAACAGTQDEPATAAARDLLAAAGRGDGGAACALLAPAAVEELEQSSGKPCDEAVLDEDLGSGDTRLDVEVFDTMAQVRFEDETVFLSRFDGDWLVVGAGCVPQPTGPYDCSIQVS